MASQAHSGDARVDAPPRSGLQTWPLPALLAWCCAWAVHRGLLAAQAPDAIAALAACTLGCLLALRQDTPWRRAMVCGGFPLSALLSGWVGPQPLALAWAWLLPIGALLLLYPVRAWRDAPLFPTPAQALIDLPTRVPLPAQASILDAGCGLGHGLQALHRAYPQARLSGVEWSAPIAWLARLLCPWAPVRRGDMWADDWQAQDMVYLFQRPESMPRAWAKACAELREGAWLVSLEFAVPGRQPDAQLGRAGEKPVWVYRLKPSDKRGQTPDATSFTTDTAG